MISITYYEELAVASLRLLIILVGILICAEIIIKSSGRLRNAMIFFLISFVPSILYTIGIIINVEAISGRGEFFSLILNFFTTLFIVFGLWNILVLVRELGGEIPEKKPANKYKEEKIQEKNQRRKRIKKPLNRFNTKISNIRTRIVDGYLDLTKNRS